MLDALNRAMNRFLPEPNSGCWIWDAAVDDRGYGRISVRGYWRHAHRFLYENLVGQVPDGLELDHKCRMNCCVNPDHLEPVTHQENVRRAGAAGALGTKNKRKTHCPNGHEYSGGNLYRGGPSNTRYCRTCRREYARNYARKRRADRP